MDGYVLQKATADFGGRKWIAWFSKDVDISEGPYKFRGLPGMIFSVEDDKGNYFFKLLKSTKLAATYDTSQYFENFAGKTALPYTQKQYQQKLLQVYNDPYFEWKQQMMANPNQVFWIMETKVTHIEQFRDLSKDEQNRMRRENNPIEIDKAVHYPLK